MTSISNISFHFPDNFRTNEDVIQLHEEFNSSLIQKEISNDDIIKYCGIRKRYISSVEETAKDLGNFAVQNLFKSGQISAKEIQYLIFVSDALDYKGPTTACVMQNDLGLPKSVGAIDVLHGCTGFIYGLSLAKALIESNQVENVLLVTADVPSKVIHPEDWYLTSIFSDAGAATLIRKDSYENSLKIGKFVLGTDGEGEHNLKVIHSATREAASYEWLEKYQNIPPHNMNGGRLIMDNPKIFLFIFRIVPKLVNEILEINNLKKEEIDYFVFHQANAVILKFLRNKLKIPEEKFIINIENIGNTVSASIPIALVDLLEEGRLQKGNKVLVAGFGIGYSWGGTVLEI